MASSEEQLEERNELIVADFQEHQKPLVCVEHPGIVEDDERAVATLGGINAISKAHFEKNVSLEMRFRPDDHYCKPTVARAKKVSNLILKVKRTRKMKKDVEGGGEVEDMELDDGHAASSSTPAGEREFEYSAEVVGIVNTSYGFPGMTDFQVLPPGLNSLTHKGQPVDPESFQFNSPSEANFTELDLPSFLPPVIFSKFDKPVSYAFRNDHKPKAEEGQGSGYTRKSGTRKLNNAYGIAFDFKGTIPTEPHPDALASIHASHPKIQVLEELFEARPIWSRAALQAQVHLPSITIRSLLALVAYNVTSGPFKTLWVRLGYDPRQDAASKQYQCFDFRVPRDVDVVMSVEYQRFNRKQQTAFQASPEFELSKDDKKEQCEPLVDEAAYMFRPDRLPGQRQQYYQLCDIKDDELQQLIHSNDGKETECIDIYGWCEESTYDKLRKALVSMVKKTAEEVKAEKKRIKEKSEEAT